MATILDNMPIYMWFQIITNILLLKFTHTQALNKSLLQNDTRQNRHYMKIGRHFEIQDGGRQGAFLPWHWPSEILIITNLAMYQISCFYHKVHDFFTYLPHYRAFLCFLLECFFPDNERTVDSYLVYVAFFTKDRIQIVSTTWLMASVTYI